MKKYFWLAIVVFLVFSSQASAKIIFIGSHGGVDAYSDYWSLGDVFDPLARYDITVSSSFEDVKTVGDVCGVEASVSYLRINTSAIIMPLISEATANVSIGANYIRQNYKSGDYVFLVGYSAGGKYVINLSDELEKLSIPVHFMGLIDPVPGLNVTIPRNVQIVDSYIQRNQYWHFQGAAFFFYNSKTTDYHSYTVTAAEGIDAGHYAIDNLEIVWANLGERMLSIVGQSPRVDVLADTTEAMLEEIAPEVTAFDYHVETIQAPTNISENDPLQIDADSDLHISSFRIREVSGGEYEHSIGKTLAPGKSIIIEGELKVRNESSRKAENVDSDYRIENKKSFDDDDLKIDEDSPFDIDPGEKITKNMSAVSITLASDGKSVTVKGDKTKNFAIKEGIAKIYFFADVEEPGGDQDISSESDKDEYAEVEITVLNTVSQKQIGGALNAINTMLFD